MITSISEWTLSQLQYSVIFGSAAALLYVGVVAAILLLGVHHAGSNNHGSGAGQLVSAIGVSTVLIVGWLLFITIIFFLVVGTAGQELTTTPAYGIWAFWNVDWINPSILKSLDSASIIYKEHGETGLALAQSLAFFMTVAKYLEIIILGFMLVMLTKLAGWSQLSYMAGNKGDGGYDSFSFGDILSFLLVFMATIIGFSLILSLINIMIHDVLVFHHTVGKPALPTTKINVLNDLWLLLKQGVDNLKSI